MNDEDVLQAMTAIRLVSAGRYREANALLPADLPGLQSFIKLQSGDVVSPPSGAFGDLVRGWTSYYQADYRVAFEQFSKAERSSVPWLKASAWIGKGKVCTDLGFFADAARWCGDASCLARQFEHDDLVATANGARGEILLRSGQPRLAAEAFSLDMGLLQPSDRFRGRVMCYQAHAYRRLGAYSAAKLAYRTSAQQPGETTAPYAYAGLAMLGAETDDAGLIDEAIRHAESFHRDARVHACIGWMYIAKARFSHRQGDLTDDLLSRAKATLPAEYVFEHSWLDHWAAIVNKQGRPGSDRITALKQFRPAPASGSPLAGCGFDSEPVERDLFNEGIASVNWAADLDQLWAQRSFFFF